LLQDCRSFCGWHNFLATPIRSHQFIKTSIHRSALPQVPSSVQEMSLMKASLASLASNDNPWIVSGSNGKSLMVNREESADIRHCESQRHFENL
jgi:hypothetical protein